MKLSVSLAEEDVAFLDRYAAEHGIKSRSAALQRALRLLKATELGPAYEAAWSEWAEGDDHVLWEQVSGDGLS